MYKPLREDNQQGGVNTTVATVTNLEKGKTRFLYLYWKCIIIWQKQNSSLELSI